MKDNTKIDGFDSLLSLFKDNEVMLIKHLLDSTYFFSVDMVKEQAQQVCNDIKSNNSVFVRFSEDGSKFYHKNPSKTSSNFGSRQEGVSFTKDDKNELYHRETDIRIKIDKDNNYAPRCAIRKATGHRVSEGKISSVTNYTIAHIWGKTDNPLFFSLMWNYCLIPNHLSQLTDKNNDSNIVVAAIKDILKAISIELYNPEAIMDVDHSIFKAGDYPRETARLKAREYISCNKIKFLPHK